MFQVELTSCGVDMPIHSEAKYRYGKLGEGSVRELKQKNMNYGIFFKFPFLQEVLCSITSNFIYHKLILFILSIIENI